MSENQIITADTSSPEYTAALSLHQQIITNGTIAANALYEMCRCLKQMRDEKLYTALGYEEFDTYCEDKANIKSRQAYNYIKIYEQLGKDFLQSNANLGITKLELLTHVNPLDRPEFLEQVDVGELSVDKLKAEIERLKAENGEKGEQLSMFEQETKGLKKKNSELLNEKADAMLRANELEKKVKELSEKPAEVAVREPDPEEIDKLVQQALAESKAKQEKEVKALKDKLGEADKNISELKASLDSEKSNAAARQEELEKKLENAQGADKELVMFEYRFKSLQEDLQKFVKTLGEIGDEDKRSKFKAAAVKYIGMISEKLSSND
ncbi:MAG: hypothetical protein ACI4JK_02175 [Oscillospiraceae bacterium]